MKTTLLQLPVILLLCLLKLNPSLQAQQLTAYDQLVSVNKEWVKQPDVDPLLKQTPAKAFSENELIQFHLQQVEKMLRKRNKPGLTTALRKTRETNLNTLNVYWHNGVFPLNDKHLARQPYFIDQYNTYCAVGYLMKESGADAMARDINRTQNYSYLIDIWHPDLMKWVQNSGLSLDELALIQPAYAGEWPSIVTEFHYRNIGPDVNEYIEVHQSNAAMFPLAKFETIRFLDAAGATYKTLLRTDMQSFTNFGQDYYYYTFPAVENMADSGRIEMINAVNRVVWAINYHDTGISIQDYNFATGTLLRTVSYGTIEDDNTPLGSSLSFCGNYNSFVNIWTPNIMPASMGLMNGCIIQPITLAAFNYVTDGKTVQLKWETATELNNNYFQIERSTDGINFTTLGKVKAVGNSNTLQRYDFTDPAPAYVNQYRLKQVDIDGKFSYSQILYVKVGAANPLQILTTLVTAKIDISVNTTAAGTINIYDFSGKKVFTQKALPGHQPINVAAYPKGNYLVQLLLNDGSSFSNVFTKQ